eukprot:11634375-Alexandrium_andersonii.AAC.1
MAPARPTGHTALSATRDLQIQKPAFSAENAGGALHRAARPTPAWWGSMCANAWPRMAQLAKT